MEEKEEVKKTVTISKEELAQLPLVTYSGNIRLVDTEELAEEAAKELRNETEIGFDTETKPSFKRGQTNNVALLQLSTHTVCYLFRLNKIGLPHCVKKILEDEKIVKIGVSIHDDFHNLHKLYSLEPAGFIDLQSFVKKYNINDNSLARIYAILFGHRISKGQRLTNWEADTLSSGQQHYAALDALACIRIYDYLLSGNFNPLESPYLREIPEEHPKDHESKSI